MESLKISPSSLSKVTPDNWSYCRFRLGEMVAFISYGAESPSPEIIQEYYYLTLQDEDFKELFQRKFEGLEEACHQLNMSYDHWDFEDPTQPSDEGGCGSCQAH